MAGGGALLDEDTESSIGLSRPPITIPSLDPDKAQIAEIDLAVVATPKLPKQDRLAGAIIRGLRKVAQARDHSAAIVEPIPRVICRPGISIIGNRSVDRWIASQPPPGDPTLGCASHAAAAVSEWEDSAGEPDLSFDRRSAGHYL